MNKKLFEDIGKRVKKRRIELGYTQEYLAEKMDVSIQMISGTECSKIHTESMIHYLEDYMYCTRKLGLYVQLVA